MENKRNFKTRNGKKGEEKRSTSSTLLRTDEDSANERVV